MGALILAAIPAVLGLSTPKTIKPNDRWSPAEIFADYDAQKGSSTNFNSLVINNNLPLHYQSNGGDQQSSSEFIYANSYDKENYGNPSNSDPTSYGNISIPSAISYNQINPSRGLNDQVFTPVSLPNNLPPVLENNGTNTGLLNPDGTPKLDANGKLLKTGVFNAVYYFTIKGVTVPDGYGSTKTTDVNYYISIPVTVGDVTPPLNYDIKPPVIPTLYVGQVWNPTNYLATATDSAGNVYTYPSAHNSGIHLVESDNVSNDATSHILNQAGTFIDTYTLKGTDLATDPSATANVTVNENDASLAVTDMTIKKGQTFDDKSPIKSMTYYDGSDSSSGKVMAKVINGSVDTNTVGSYVLTYGLYESDGTTPIVDSRGNAVTKKQLLL